MVSLLAAKETEQDQAMAFINQAKAYLKTQGIDQWQKGYPDAACIQQDLASGKGFFLLDGAEAVGYLCIDFDGEPAYEGLVGAWQSGPGTAYATVHRMAISSAYRGKGIASLAFALVEKLCHERSISSIRVDTDADNQKMQHILRKSGFAYYGTITFDNSEKIAFEKLLG